MTNSAFRKATCSEVVRVLHEARVSKGMSMTDLADGAGLSRAMISFVEREIRHPTLDTLLRMVEVLELSFAEVIKLAESRARLRLGDNLGSR